MKSAVVAVLHIFVLTPIITVDVMAKSYAMLTSHLWTVGLLVWVIYLLKPKVRKRYEKIYFDTH